MAQGIEDGGDDIGQVKVTSLGQTIPRPGMQKSKDDWKRPASGVSTWDLIVELCQRGFDVQLTKVDPEKLERRRKAAAKKAAKD